MYNNIISTKVIQLHINNIRILYYDKTFQLIFSTRMFYNVNDLESDRRIVCYRYFVYYNKTILFLDRKKKLLRRKWLVYGCTYYAISITENE